MNRHKEPKIFYGYIIVAASFLIYMVMWGIYYTFGIFFEPLLAEFGWTRAATSGAFSLAFVFLAISGVVIGRLTDRFGPRIVVTVCSLIFGLGCVLMSQVNSVWQLYLFYGVLIGTGISGSFIPPVSTVARWFVRKRGMMTGIAVSGLGIGMLVMSPVANWLISSYGWRTSYVVVGVASMLLALLGAQFLKHSPGKIGQLPYGGNGVAGSEELPVTGFSMREAIRTWQFWVLGGAWLSLGLDLGAVMAHIVPHAIVMGIPAASAAVILSIIGGLNTTGRVMLGIIGDRIGHRRALIVGFAFMSAALFWVLVAEEVWMLYLFAALFGFGYGGMVVLMSPVLAELFGLQAHGIIMGLILVLANLGTGVSPVLTGFIFDITGSYNLAFLIFAVLSVAGLVLVLLLKPTGGKAGTEA